MPGTDKREAAYSQARAELFHEMLRAGVFDRDEHERGEQVAGIVRALRRRYPELDDQMERRLIGEGMQRTYGDATMSEAAQKGRRDERGAA
ncbi:MAG: hypothetical protein DIU52_007095 [bacterium]|jgi:uncharacterized protein YutE (UPF0331/DUF86 family)|nr:MAG: hypothetical protein DIU52_02045 [bacterium]